MRLTLYTDYSLRVLIYLVYYPDKTVTISELADFYKVSRNHLVKVVHELGRNGYIETSRGKHGGIRLARPADQIIIGEVIRTTEPDFNMLECFDAKADHCVITNVCNLKSVLINAKNNFLGELDRYTLADMTKSKGGGGSLFKSIPVVQG